MAGINLPININDLLININDSLKRAARMFPVPPQPKPSNELPPTVNTTRFNIAVRGGAAFTGDYQPLNRAARRFLEREARLNRKAIAARNKYDATLA